MSPLGGLRKLGRGAADDIEGVRRLQGMRAESFPAQGQVSTVLRDLEGDRVIVHAQSTGNRAVIAELPEPVAPGGAAHILGFEVMSL